MLERLICFLYKNNIDMDPGPKMQLHDARSDRWNEFSHPFLNNIKIGVRNPEQTGAGGHFPAVFPVYIFGHRISLKDQRMDQIQQGLKGALSVMYNPTRGADCENFT